MDRIEGIAATIWLSDELVGQVEPSEIRRMLQRRWEQVYDHNMLAARETRRGRSDGRVLPTLRDWATH